MSFLGSLCRRLLSADSGHHGIRIKGYFLLVTEILLKKTPYCTLASSVPSVMSGRHVTYIVRSNKRKTSTRIPQSTTEVGITVK